MRPSTVISIILAILVLIGFGLFFSNQQKISELENNQNARISSAESENERLLREQEELEIARRAERQKAQDALAAKRMAEAQTERERMEKERLISELNQKLTREVEEKRQAELAQAELNKRMQELAEAQKIAEQKISELEKTRSEETGSEKGSDLDSLRSQLAQQKEQMEELEEENLVLKEKQEMLLAQQDETAETIVQMGGKVEVPYPELLSPNFRRKFAIDFKENLPKK